MHRIVKNKVVCGDLDAACAQKPGGKTLTDLAEADEGDPGDFVFWHCGMIPLIEAGKILTAAEAEIK